MRQAGACGSVLLAAAALGAVLLVWPMADAAAQLTGLVDTVTTPLPDPATGTTGLVGAALGTTTVLAATGAIVGGTSDALQASALTGDIPSLLTGEALHAVTIGWPDQIASEASLAALDLSVAGINIGADFVMARALTVFGAAGIALTSVDQWLAHPGDRGPESEDRRPRRRGGHQRAASFPGRYHRGERASRGHLWRGRRGGRVGDGRCQRRGSQGSASLLLRAENAALRRNAFQPGLAEERSGGYLASSGGKENA